MQKVPTKEVTSKSIIDKEEPRQEKSNMESILEELPQLLVTHAYTKLKSGEPLTASELKVCLDVCKAYSAATIIKQPENILETVPFDIDG
jgi:hypothetical protein|tara:strand:- start:1013 stop:1282 length:270 start_codon:yes stop_codon:yes gene_type:complete